MFFRKKKKKTMWAEFAISSFLVALTLALQIWCDACFESVQLAPRTIGVVIASFGILESPVAQAAGCFFAIHLQVSWAFPIFLCLGLLGWDITHSKHENAVVVVGLVSLAFVGLYAVMQALDANRETLFVPLFFAFVSASAVWVVWIRQAEGRLFPLFVMGGMLNLLVQMFLVLVPHPPLSLLKALWFPMVVYLIPVVFMGYKTAVKKDLRRTDNINTV